MTPAFLLGQQRDESRFEAARPGLRLDFIRSTNGQQLARVHPHQPIESFRLVHVSGGYQDTHSAPARADAVDELPELPTRQRIDTRGGLVEDQQVGVVDQRAAKPELLLHAPGELARGPTRERRQASAIEQFRDARRPLRPGLAKQAPEEINVLEDRKRRIQIPSQPLGHVGDAGADRAAMGDTRHIAPEHVHRAFLDLAHPGDDREQRGFSDAVRPEEADHAPGRHHEVHSLQGDRLPIVMAQLS